MWHCSAKLNGLSVALLRLPSQSTRCVDKIFLLRHQNPEKPLQKLTGTGRQAGRQAGKPRCILWTEPHLFSTCLLFYITMKFWFPHHDLPIPHGSRSSLELVDEIARRPLVWAGVTAIPHGDIELVFRIYVICHGIKFMIDGKP